MAVKVAIAGASGYAGGELLRLLLAHPRMEIGAVTAASSVGSELGEHHPHLPRLANRILEETSPQVLAGHDVVFLALPHGHSAEIASALPDETLVIDLAADHRLVDPKAWRRWYGTDHAAAWTYGLPEMPGVRSTLVGANRIAVPGCFPTGGTLAIMPALIGKIIQPDVTIVSVTGTSGAGKSLATRFLASEITGSATVYGVGGTHRHTPEFSQNFRKVSGHEVAVSFTPVLAPMTRGILTTASAPLVSTVDADTVRDVYQKQYDAEPFINLLPATAWPNTKAIQGSNRVDIQVTVDSDANRLIAVSAIDNLTKGTAGGAIQAMNIALGFDESLGLSITGLAP